MDGKVRYAPVRGYRCLSLSLLVHPERRTRFEATGESVSPKVAFGVDYRLEVIE